MPVAKLPIPNMGDTVIRSIVKQVLMDLRSNLGIKDSAFISMEDLMTEGSFESGVNASIANNTYETPAIESVSSKITNNVLSNSGGFSTIAPIIKPIFASKNLAIGVVNSQNEISIDLTYYTKSKINMDEVITYLRNQYLNGDSGYVHAVDYYTVISTGLLGLIEDVYTTAKLNHDDGIGFLEFIKNANIVNSIVLSSDVNGLNGEVGLVSRGKLTDVAGVFSSDLKTTKGEYDKDESNWGVTMSYKVNVTIPEIYHISFSTLVNNSLLPQYYYYDVITDSKDSLEPGLYGEGYTLLTSRKEYVNIPAFDVFKPTMHNNTFSTPLCSILVAISADDRRGLFSLSNMSSDYNYEFTDLIYNYMLTNYDKLKLVNSLFDSIVNIELYKDNKLQHSSLFEVDSELNITATEDLDITSTYRLVIRILTRMNILTNLGRETLEGLDDTIFDDILGVSKSTPYETSIGLPELAMVSRVESSMMTSQLSTIKTLLKKGD